MIPHPLGLPPSGRWNQSVDMNGFAMLMLPFSSHYFSHVFHVFLLFQCPPYKEAQASLCLEFSKLLHPLESPQRKTVNCSELISDSSSCVLQLTLTGVPTHLPWALSNITCLTVVQSSTHPFLLLHGNLARLGEGSAFVSRRIQSGWKLWPLPCLTVLLSWSQGIP